MEEARWNVLLIEDDEEDYILTREILSDVKGTQFDLVWKSTFEDGRQGITQGGFDVILLDYHLGSRSGLELIREASQAGVKTPIILLTGRGNYEIDLEAMKSGATDYLSKNEVNPGMLERAIRYAILRKQNEDELRAAKEELELRVRERTYELIRKNDALVQEVLERRRIENELAEVQRRLLDRAEAERRELAREIHDGPMQEIYGIIFAMDTILDGETPADALKSRMLQIVQSLRTISRDLRPPALAPYGLQKAIQSHLDSLQQAHPELKIQAELMPDGQMLPERVRMALYRIYQMAITNVIRHAKADEVRVALSFNRDELVLEIHDNGCGFKIPDRWIELARQGHLGLVGAQERAEAIGGSLHVESEEGMGTLLRVIAPRFRDP